MKGLNLCLQASTHRMFDFSYSWLILGSNMSHSLQNLNETGFSIVTDLAILLPDLAGNETDYVLYDVYNLCKWCGGMLNVTQLGTWAEYDGLTITLNGSRIFRRRNFRGLRAKAVGIVSSFLATYSYVIYSLCGRMYFFIGAT